MIRTILFSVCILLLIGCNSRQSSTSSDSSLLTLDVSQDYPVRKINLHDFADVEYVPLETANNSLLTNVCSQFFISDKYIITYDLNSGNIFFFNRAGKHLWTVNRKGEGSQEYVSLDLVVDFDSEECIVFNYLINNILIYTFKGEYKRCLQGIPYRSNLWFHNYDKEYMLAYNSFYNYQTQECEDEHPYYLMSKKDGKMYPIGLNIKNRISKTVHAEPIDFPGGGSVDRTTFLIHPILTNGSDILIADFTLDTLYRFTERKLTPVMVRTPAVRSTDPPLIINPQINTESYFCFELMPFYYNPSNPFEATERMRFLACNKSTGKIEEWLMYDPNYSLTDNLVISMDVQLHDSQKNIVLGWYNADKLVERYEEGALKGELREIASKLKEDDNKVLVLWHFK